MQNPFRFISGFMTCFAAAQRQSMVFCALLFSLLRLTNGHRA